MDATVHVYTCIDNADNLAVRNGLSLRTFINIAPNVNSEKTFEYYNPIERKIILNYHQGEMNYSIWAQFIS